MPTPATNGVLRTKLSDMKVGDYIKWYNSGNFALTPDVPSNAVEYSTVNSSLDRIKITLTTAGSFYFIKVASGLCIADRHVVGTDCSRKILNKSNVFKGYSYRSITAAEYDTYIVKSDLAGNIKPNDINTWHWINIDAHNIVGEVTQDSGLIVLPTGSWTGLREATYDATALVDGHGDDAEHFGYRPVMEYVDNSKSTNIFY